MKTDSGRFALTKGAARRFHTGGKQMLTLILGCAGTGKTTQLLNAVRARAEQGKYCVYLVPEQSSQAAEVLCWQALGPKLSHFCQPASFRTLAERIEAAAGGGAVPVVSDAVRSVFVRRAVESLGDEVRYYRRHRRNTAFLTQCAELVERFKMAGADAAALEKLTMDGAAGERLTELVLIYAAYEAALAGKALDPEDRLTRAADRLPAALYADTAFFLDDFDSFTAPEYALLRRLLASGAGVTAALCCDGLSDPDEGLGLFSPVKSTAARLIRIAKSEGEPVAAPQILPRPLRAHAPALAALNALLRGQPAAQAKADGLFYTQAADRYEECRLTAAKIRALAMEGMPYCEMAVICRDTAQYAPAIEEAFRQYDIPLFTDALATAEYTAPSAFLRAALDLASGGLSCRGLLALVKSGLTGVGTDAAAAFENYLFVWQPGAADLRAPFVLNPEGFGPMQEENQELLDLAESARQALVAPLERFLAAVRSASGKKLAKELYLLLTAYHAADELTALAESTRAAGDAAAADDALRSWDLAMEALDTMSRLLGDDAAAPLEFAELLTTLLRTDEVGSVPRTQNAVVLTGADRMRLSGPACAFVLGLTEGDFPRAASPAGLLSGADRDFLAASGIELPGSFESKVLLEEMFLYRALTCAGDKLYLFSPRTAGGEPKTLCAPVARAVELLCPPELVLRPEDLCAGEGAALCQLAADYAADTPRTAALEAALADSTAAADTLAKLRLAAAPRSFAVKDTAVLRRLLGRRMTLSPSRIEQYYRCSYGYFLQYVLKLRVRKPAQLSPTQSGSFVHYILEHALGLLGDGFTAASDEELTRLAEQLADQYIAENIPAGMALGSRFGYLVGRIKANTAKLLCFMREEQKQSSFRPEAFELQVGEEDVPGLHLTTPAGEQITVKGTIDRVDVMHREGENYVRVVDYKTGVKEFALDEVYEGLDLQMLLYLFSLCDAKTGSYANSHPAGVLYLLADPAPQVMERQAAGEWSSAYKVDGLVLDDEMVINAMDHDCAGVFIPVRRNKSGGLAKQSKLADLAKLGRIRQRIEELILQMAQQLYGGSVDAAPLVAGKSPCESCDFCTVCCHEAGKNERAVRVKKDVFDREGTQDADMDAAAAGCDQ